MPREGPAHRLGRLHRHRGRRRARGGRPRGGPRRPDARRRRTAPTDAARRAPTSSTSATPAAWAGAARGVDAVCHQAARGRRGRHGRRPARRTPPTTTSAPPRCWRRCTRPASTGWCSPPRWSSTARAATPAPSTATRCRRRAAGAALEAGDFENHCPRLRRARSAGRWSTRTPGSTRAAATPPARSPRSTTPPPGCARPTPPRWRCATTTSTGPGMPRDTPYSGVAAMFRSSLERGERAAGLRGRRPDARLRARRRRRPRQRRWRCEAVAATRRRALRGLQRLLRRAGRRSSTWPSWSRAGTGRGLAPEVTGGYRLGDVRHVVASPERARAELGFTRRGRAPSEGLPAFATAPLRDVSAGSPARVEQVLHEQRA